MRKNPANYAGPAQSGTFYDITDAVVGRGYEFNAQSWAYTAGLFESSAELTEKSVVMDGYELVLENYYSISQESRGNVNSVIGAYEGRYVSREALISNLRQNGIEIKERIVVGDTRLEITAEGVKMQETSASVITLYGTDKGEYQLVNTATQDIMPIREVVNYLNDIGANISLEWNETTHTTTVRFNNIKNGTIFQIIYNLERKTISKFDNGRLVEMKIYKPDEFLELFMMKNATGGDVIKASVTNFKSYAGLEADPYAEFGINSDTYKILMDIDHRLRTTNDPTERSRLVEIANDAKTMARAGTPYKFGNDAIKALLHENNQTMMDYYNGLANDYWYLVSGGKPAEATFVWLIGKHFGNQDEPNWDYKWDINWQIPIDYPDSFYGEYADAPNKRNWYEWIYFEGVMIGADKVANINWGYLGTNLGYSGFYLFNPLTTGGDDDRFIQMGVDLANSGY